MNAAGIAMPMMLKKTSVTVAFVLCSFSCATLAQEVQSTTNNPASESGASFSSEGKTSIKTSRKVTSSRQKSKVAEYGTSLILSPEAGAFSALPATQLEKFGPKFGLALEGKALGSVLLRKFLIDAGAGWFFFNIKGFEPFRNLDGSTKTDDEGNTLTENMSIKLSGALFELGVSYRFSNSVFMGAIAQLRYPVDLTYESKVARSELGFLTGGQLGYQIFNDDFNTRFVVRLLSTLNDKNWLGISTTAGVQLGLPFVQPKILTIRELTTKSKEKKIVEYKKQEYKFKVVRDVVKIILDNTVTFIREGNTPTLTLEAQKFLLNFAAELSRAEQEWGVLRIDSASPAHIARIRETLISAGVSGKKIKAGQTIQGEAGDDLPVEFSFYGAKENSQFLETIRGVMKNLSVPETCVGALCE